MVNMCAANLRRAEDKAMGDLLQPWHLIVLAVVAFLLFGAKRLPELGKGLGEGLKGFKEGIRGISDPPPPVQTVQQSAPPPPPAAPVEPQIVRKDG
jgi:sec-independent protein translocase protein TatA